MANSKFGILVIVILLTFGPSSVIPSSSPNVSVSSLNVSVSSPNVSVSYPKVLVYVFYNAMDHDVALPEFLYYVHNQSLIRMMDLHMVPYATARLGADSSVICEGGPDECFISRVEICGIKHLNQYDSSSLIFCLSFYPIEENWKKCLEAIGLEEMRKKRVTQCFTGYEGKQMEYKYVKDMSTLIIDGDGPLPWITVNGVQQFVTNGNLMQNLENLKNSICEAYKGEKTETCRAKDGHPKISTSGSGRGHGAIFPERLP